MHVFTVNSYSKESYALINIVIFDFVNDNKSVSFGAVFGGFLITLSESFLFL